MLVFRRRDPQAGGDSAVAAEIDRTLLLVERALQVVAAGASTVSLEVVREVAARVVRVAEAAARPEAIAEATAAARRTRMEVILQHCSPHCTPGRQGAAHSAEGAER